MSEPIIVISPFTSWLIITTLILFFLSLISQMIELSFPSSWHKRAFCKCGWSDQLTHGDVWFTRIRYPICPNCGAPHTGYVVKVCRYNKFKLEEKHDGKR